MKLLYVYNSPRDQLFGNAGASPIPTNMYWGAEELRARGHEILWETEKSRWHWWGTPVGWVLSRLTGCGIPLERLVHLSSKIRACDVVVFGPQALVFGYGFLRRVGYFKQPALGLVVGDEFTGMKGDPRSWSRRLLLRYSIMGIDLVVSLCPLETENLKKWAGGLAERFLAIRQGIDGNYYSPRKRPDDLTGGKYIIAVGSDRFRDWKTFAEIAAKSPWHFKAVAEERAIAGISFPPNVEVICKSMMMETRELLAGASLVLVTTKPSAYFSGFTTMLAAMAMGRPVAFDNPTKGAVYGLKDGENAIVIPRADAAGATQILDRWMADPEALEALAEAGQKIALTNTMERFSVQLEQRLRETADGIRTPPTPSEEFES